MLACQACEVAKQRPEVQLEASRPNFVEILEKQCRHLQSRIAFEHSQVITANNDWWQEEVNSLKREIQELRLKLRLPLKNEERTSAFSPQRRPDQAIEPAAEQLLVPEFNGQHIPSASDSQQIKDNYKRQPKQIEVLVVEDRADIPEQVLAVALRSAPADRTDAETPGNGTNLVASIMDTNDSSAMPSVERRNSPFEQFELWPAWMQEHRTYPHSITNLRSKNSTKAIIPHENVAPVERTRCIMSPGHPFVFGWSVVFLLCLVYELVLFPLQAFPINTDGALRIISILAIVFWTVDLVLNFFTGYLDKKGDPVLDHHLIWKNYLKSWFFFDTLVVAVDWITLFGSSDMSDIGFMRSLKSFRVFRILRAARILRLRKLRDAVRHVDEIVDSDYFAMVRSILIHMCGVLVISHYIACIWFFIGDSEKDGNSWVGVYKLSDVVWPHQYLKSLHWSLTQFTPGSVSIQAQNATESLYSVFVLVFGLFVFSSIVGNITSSTNSLKNISAKYDKQILLLRRYFREQDISRELVFRVMTYTDGTIRPKMEHVNQNEVLLLKMLPQSLCRDVMLEIYARHINTHHFFEKMCERNRSMMQRVCCMALEEINMSQGDELFIPGQIAHAMFFVIGGQLTYTMEHVQKAQIVNKKSWFCEAVLWTPWVHQGSMLTNVSSELLAIDSSKFREVVMKYHTDLWIPKKYGEEFVKRLNALAGFFTEDSTDNVSLSDLLCIESAIELLDQMDF